MIRVAICDDEKECQLHIQKQVLTIFEKLNETIETYLYGDGKEVIRTLIKDENDMDILLLDINMPGLSGIQVAKAIRERNISILIIFVSAQEQYVFESIKYQPFRFVRKSTINRELEPALIAAIGNIHMQNCMRIHIKTENGRMWIAQEDILYCETLGRKVEIYMKNGCKYTINKHLKEIKEQIDIDKYFLQIHSGCIVNSRYIKAFSNDEITMSDDMHLIVSRRRMKDVKESLIVFWGRCL